MKSKSYNAERSQKVVLVWLTSDNSELLKLLSDKKKNKK